MHRTLVSCIALLLLSGTVHAKEASDKGGDKQMSGMSIVGNDDAPKALVIVPWKSSELGDTLDVSRGLDDGRQPSTATSSRGSWITTRSGRRRRERRVRVLDSGER